MFRRLMNVLPRNRKSKTNADKIKLDMGNNVHSSTHVILNTTANDASGVYETINSTVQDNRYPPAVNTRNTSADSPSLSVLSNTACDGSNSLISDAFWSEMLKIQSNFQEAAQIYEDILSPTGIIEYTCSNAENTSVGTDCNYPSVSGEDSESTLSLAFSLPNDINTSDVSFTDGGLEHSNFDKVSLEYMVTLNLLQVEKEFAHHLAALQKFREVLTHKLSNDQETIIFQNMNELGVISEVCADELRVILNASQRPNLDCSNDTASEVQLTVEDIYDACFSVFREEHDAYIQGLDKALALCKKLHRSTSFFSDVMTNQQFELFTYLLTSPTYHAMNIATALKEVQKALVGEPKDLEDLVESEIDDETHACPSDVDNEDMIVSFNNSTFVQGDADNTHNCPADKDNTCLPPVNPVMLPIAQDDMCMCPIIRYDAYLRQVIPNNTCIPSMGQDITYLSPVDKEVAYLSSRYSDNTYLSEVEQDNSFLSPVDSDNMRISPVGQDNSFMSYVDPELITRRQFLSHYQQQGMSADMRAVRADEVDKVSKFKRGYIMTASRRDYVRNRFRSTNVFITLVEDM